MNTPITLIFILLKLIVKLGHSHNEFNVYWFLLMCAFIFYFQNYSTGLCNLNFKLVKFFAALFLRLRANPFRIVNTNPPPSSVRFLCDKKPHYKCPLTKPDRTLPLIPLQVPKTTVFNGQNFFVLTQNFYFFYSVDFWLSWILTQLTFDSVEFLLSWHLTQLTFDSVTFDSVEFLLSWLLTQLTFDSVDFWLSWLLTQVTFDSGDFWLSWILTQLTFENHFHFMPKWYEVGTMNKFSSQH